LIVLDTSVLSLAFRRRRGDSVPPPAVTELAGLIQRDEPLGVPGIVLQELLSGVRTDEQFQRLADLMAGFPLLPTRREDHLAAARISNACRRKGASASTIDCLIAAQTISMKGELFTVDRDFGEIAEHTRLSLYEIRAHR
jgi:predicted nucleic acid-binding protein